ncbi:hypothetical protein [Corynebacterium sp. AOP12-C2-36]|uniref:hypothetical protein n=1 Tax=Corynebacterium sp. AOP12-C2-36 TaxID=3457723 RepID=UPI0040347F18
MAETVYDEIRKITARARASETIDAYAWAMAVGVGADDPDPDRAGIVVICHRRKLFSLSISPGYADPDQIPLSNTGTLVNGAIMAAFDLWEKEFYRLRDHARSVVDSLGDAEGHAALRDEIERLHPIRGTELAE